MIHDESDQKGMYDFLGSHALISDDSVAAIEKQCDFSPNASQYTRKCLDAMDEADTDLYYIDIYNIYAPSCTSSNLTAKPKIPSVSNKYIVYIHYQMHM